ncbi:phospholipase D-like domain-containing protein [Blastococcus goldschmidtiae]|uniref:Phospholipase D-like domain-containing protein n=1 Tax=Blastococcus goldschmidtiae TaxID=3075546 RepID=A0ABU2K8C2_9ACTN|nr:phospholipase D-like domain-containing protein [Blastococcus sp. DSM 46792]MDT0276444.1 phospholipase D-like domain-containing protein [Blastococcus sp. DSM 46792]
MRRPALEALVGVPFTDGNRIDVLKNGNQTFPALLEAIRTARRTIDMIWFAWSRGEVTRQVTDALVERAADGVRVRVMIDGFGGKDVDRAELGRLRAAGCPVLFYRPLPSWRPTVWNMRTHRRVLVCDETVAFTGGTGIARTWTGQGDRPGDWRDTAYRVQGPAVAGLRSAFVTAWMQAYVRLPGALLTEQDEFPALGQAGDTAVQVLRPPSQPGWNEAAIAIAALLHTARDTVRVATPYARLPRWLLELVVATARRGVRVQLLVSGPHVERPAVHLQAETDFRPMLDAGVEIWRFQPTLMHTKVITVDAAVAMVGTTNFDARSLALNEQVAMVIEDAAVVGLLDDHFDDDLGASERVLPAAWRSRGARRRALEMAAELAGRPLRGWGALGLAGRSSGHLLGPAARTRRGEDG